MSTPFIIVSGDYIALLGDMIQADTSGGSFTITLPASADIGDYVVIDDAKLSWNNNNLTLDPNGLNINGGTSNYVASVVGNKLSIVYISLTYGWSIK